jgi:hypothetical protein
MPASAAKKCKTSFLRQYLFKLNSQLGADDSLLLGIFGSNGSINLGAFKNQKKRNYKKIVNLFTSKTKIQHNKGDEKKLRNFHRTKQQDYYLYP